MPRKPYFAHSDESVVASDDQKDEVGRGSGQAEERRLEISEVG